MKVIFAGTPEFSAQALQALLAAGFEVPLVLTQADRPAGRGMQLQASAVKQLALAHGIPVAQPLSLRLDGKHPEVAQAAHDLLRATPHDVMVVAAYGLILPPSILEIPPLGCINIHASLLPRWRGAAPIQRAIEAGDSETGITIMQMDQGLDTGAMLMKQSLPITSNDTTATLHDKLAVLGSNMIVEALRQSPQTLAAVSQTEDGANYAAKILKEEATLDFTQSADVIARKIRAFNPFPGAYVVFNGVNIKIWQAEVLPVINNNNDTNHAQPGQILTTHANEGIIVACGKGALRIMELQKPGGKRLSAAQFLQGFSMEGGQFA